MEIIIFFIIQYTLSGLLFWIIGMLLVKHNGERVGEDLSSTVPFMLSLWPVIGIVISIIYLFLFAKYLLGVDSWDIEKIMMSLHKKDEDNS
jgi:phosphotransferase system  glucose/maltose/N-acetylglucosamine-specific IIC component